MTEKKDKDPGNEPEGNEPATGEPNESKATPGGFWDDDEIKKAAEGGSFIKFDAVGDTAEGVITALGKRKFPAKGNTPERTAIEITFDDGRILTAGQVLLMRVLYELMPVEGETLKVTLAAIEKKGTNTLKIWRVELTRLDGTVEKIDQTS